MKKILLLVVLVVALLVGVFVVYVSTIDWNTHKDRIANQFSSVTSKKVVFVGSVDFKVFPKPYLEANNVQIFNEDSYSKDKSPLAEIKTLYADISLLPLIQGKFDIKEMVLVEPKMFLEVLPDGRLNWQSKEDYDKDREKIDVSLDSLRIENATVNILSPENNINFLFDKLNAVVSADSIFGPYRVEGTYMKDKSPEGFALSLGKFSDSFATSLNFSVRDPRSDSYLRFDGSFFLRNSAVNGGIVVESAKSADFLNSYLDKPMIPSEMNYPLATSFEINTNKTKIDISNFVIKYGTTIGAGNILLPIKASEYDYGVSSTDKPKVEVSFNMTDLDLTPFVVGVNEFVKNHSKSFSTDLGYDVLFDIKSLKTNYKNQNIKDFEVSLDVLNNKINLNKFVGYFPGDTSIDVMGEIFPVDDVLSYNLEVQSKSEDSLGFVEWLGYKIPTINTHTYRKSDLRAKLSGNVENVKISPIDFTIDKMKFIGEMGVVVSERPYIYANINSDSINFDNYVAKPKLDINDNGIVSNLQYYFSQISALKDFDIIFDGRLNLGILQKVPFDNTELSFKLENGVMNVEKLNITSIKNSSVNFSGNVFGFGDEMKFSNLKYEFETQDFSSVFKGYKLPEVLSKAKDLRKFTAKGILSGNFDKMATRSLFNMDDMSLTYIGEIQKINNKNSYTGKADIRATDFLRMINRFNIPYNPKVLSMGLFRMNGDIKGPLDNFEMNNFEMFIGNNRFVGKVGHKEVAGRSDYMFDLDINQFELDRFFYNKASTNSNAPAFNVDKEAGVDFLKKPQFSKTKIDYSDFSKFNAYGQVRLKKLTYGKNEMTDVIMGVDLKNSMLKISRMSGTYKEAKINSDILLDMNGETKVETKTTVERYKLTTGELSGNKFGITSGVVGTQISLNSVATSMDDMFSRLSGKIKFEVDKPVVKGFGVIDVYNDLKTRKKIDGFEDIVLNALTVGDNNFSKIRSELTFTKGSYYLERLDFIAPEFTILTVGKGKVGLWDMKFDHVVDLSNIKKGYSLKFFLTGPASSPQLTYDVDTIVSDFEKKVADAEEVRVAKEKSRKEKLREEATVEQNKISEVNYALKTNIIEFIAKRDGLTQNPVIVKRYQEMATEATEARNALDDIFQKLQSEDVSSEDIDLAKKEIAGALRTSDFLAKDIETIYYQDLKDVLNRKYNTLSDEYLKARNMIVRYRDAYVRYPARMIVVGEPFKVAEYPSINDNKEKIESIFANLDSQNSKASKEYLKIQNLNDVKELQKYSSDIDVVIEKYSADKEELGSVIKTILEDLEELVSKKEEDYDKVFEVEDVKAKVEDSIGSISTSTGKNITIKKDAEEIKRLENERGDEVIRVLDFSKGKDNKGKVLKETPKRMMSREEIAKKVEEKTGSGILKKIDDDALAATGKISRE